MEKQCTRCHEVKPLDCFYNKPPAKKRERTGHGKKAMCKQCYKDRALNWAKNNPERRRELVRKSAEKNREKKLAYYNSEQAKALAAKWRKEHVVASMRRRRQRNPLYAFTVRMRTMLLKSFAKRGYTKRSKSQQILGCTWPELVAHIERQFAPGMTWENRGEWHIDHIIPLATAETEADIVRLNHYTNLQPLWAEDNLRKGDKVITTQKEENGICESR